MAFCGWSPSPSALPLEGALVEAVKLVSLSSPPMSGPWHVTPVGDVVVVVGPEVVVVVEAVVVVLEAVVVVVAAVVVVVLAVVVDVPDVLYVYQNSIDHQ
jgi:hypothetical protein